MKTRLWWLVAALLSTPALAADLFESPRTAAQAETDLRAAMPGLGQVQVLRGRYSQRKFLREIPRPLISSGEFLLVRDRGIWWHTLTPLDSELMLPLVVAGLPRPATRALGKGQSTGQEEHAASLFMALFTLDLDLLARSFDLFVIRSEAPEPRWSLGLRPRDAAVAAWFEQATLSGGERVERVTLFEAAGDRTEIDLDSAAQQLSSLTAAERQHFEH